MRLILALATLTLGVGAALTACDDTDSSIGSSCRIDDDCAESQSCEGGFCVDDRACVCPALYEPVCGTNGRTYGNECEAGCAGVGVASPGRCPGPDLGDRDFGAVRDTGMTGDGAVDGATGDGAPGDGAVDGASADAAPDAAADLGADATADLGPDAEADAGLMVDSALVTDAMPDMSLPGDR